MQTKYYILARVDGTADWDMVPLSVEGPLVSHPQFHTHLGFINRKGSFYNPTHNLLFDLENGVPVCRGMYYKMTDTHEPLNEYGRETLNYYGFAV
jgi:hypothetical protein